MTKEDQLKMELLLVDSLFRETIRNKKWEQLEIKKIKKLAGDASSRKYYRVETSQLSYVVCLDQPFEKVVDNNFLTVQKFLNQKAIRVPEVYDCIPSKGYILEEDLGDGTMLRKLSGLNSQKEEFQCYKMAIDQMIKIHDISPESAGGQIFTQMAFDEEKLMNEVNFTIKHLIQNLFQQNLDERKKRILENSFREICQELAEVKRVVTHRDFHSRNLMWKDDQCVVIDFQDARMGPPQYDLVSLLEDCYYKISRKNRFDLKNYYWSNFLEKKKLQNSYEEFSIFYDKMTIQRIFKALGSFAYIYGLRGDIRYLKYVGYAFEKLRDILFRYEKYNDLRMVLSEIYYEY